MDRVRQWAHTPVRLLLGGTFNPIHVGHIRLALECQWRTGAEHVDFLPAPRPPHKERSLAQTHHRLEMVRLVVDELNHRFSHLARFAVEACEFDRSGHSYTVDTLAALHRVYPDECLVWLVGMDSLAHLHHWDRWRQLTDHANLLVVNRPGFAAPEAGEVGQWVAQRQCALQDLPQRGGGVAIVEIPPLAISSTDLRRQVRQGCSPAYLVTPAVDSYIAAHQLYQDSETDCS